MFEVPAFVPVLAFFVSIVAIGAIFALGGTAFVKPDFDFFPPPGKDSWQHKAFISLFRLFVYPLFALSVMTFDPSRASLTSPSFISGVLLVLIGFGMAFWITGRMGWRNAFGEKRGLVTDGWFRWSRNPVYVATWLGLLGWALVVGNTLVSVLLALWALLYVFAPLSEEPWLIRMYGDAYESYMRRTPRFLGRPREAGPKL